MTRDALLAIQNLSASVDEKPILDGVNLEVAQGEVHVLMGPNGAGKSTMGHVAMGDPTYTITDGKIIFDGVDITDLTPDKRSRAGLFLSFQAPVEIPGVPLSSFLRATLEGREGMKMKNKEFRKRIKSLAEELDFGTEWLDRELGVGFSGGEKKKVEMLQLLLLQPKPSLTKPTRALTSTLCPSFRRAWRLTVSPATAPCSSSRTTRASSSTLMSIVSMSCWAVTSSPRAMPT